MKLLLFSAILVLGIVIRIQAITPFKIYPDSYQSLIVAQNIQDYQSVVGYLGPQGMLYPDFFSWTRPGYPLLIKGGTLFFSDTTQIAQYLSFFAGLFTLPLVFWLLTILFRSRWYGLCGMFILAISFHHAVWGGFIMTETIGVFFLSLFILGLFSKRSFSVYHTMLIGILFSYAVLVRYEYLVLIFPIMLFSSQERKPFLRFMILFFTAFLFIIFSIFYFLFPLSSLTITLVAQLHDFFPLVLGGLLFSIILVISKRQLPLLNPVVLLILSSIVVASFFTENLIAIRGFVFHDFFLVILFFYGSVLLQKKEPYVLLFILFSISTLYSFYYVVNPTMDRYLTHLIPFLLIPASYGLKDLLLRQKMTKRNILLRSILITIIVLQIALSFSGFRLLRDQSWFHPSYEEQAAQSTQKYILEDNALLVVAQPEPYFYSSNYSIESIADTYPYLFFRKTGANKPMYLIQDKGMEVYFPKFTSFLETRLSNEKIAEFTLSETFHMQEKTFSTNTPIKVYKTTIESLKNEIENAKNK